MLNILSLFDVNPFANIGFLSIDKTIILSGYGQTYLLDEIGNLKPLFRSLIPTFKHALPENFCKFGVDMIAKMISG